MKKMIKQNKNSKIKKDNFKIEKDSYFKYRWFYTSSGKLVIGGKNALQNEEIVSNLIKSGKNYLVMHTKDPGSPFAVIQSEIVSPNDIEEIAIFTGCFSRAWRENKKQVVVDIFQAIQLIKKKSMKVGTFGVSGNIQHKKVDLKLYLTKQKSVLRAVPFKPKEKNVICIFPGKIDKQTFAEQMSIKLEIVRDEVLQALPAGGFKTCNL
ncbi:MAG TPA: NFACT RNA binding domain-containing protein [Candidatus Paceibacterota bacterium]|nr:NFACT RNA binding domain-containing protein [Candidatus Paceibacterota bacterium]